MRELLMHHNFLNISVAEDASGGAGIYKLPCRRGNIVLTLPH